MKLNSAEKKFIENITNQVHKSIRENEKSWKSMQSFQQDINSWEQSNDYLRSQFYAYFRQLLIEISLFRKNLLQISGDISIILDKNEKFLLDEEQEDSYV